MYSPLKFPLYSPIISIPEVSCIEYSSKVSLKQEHGRSRAVIGVDGRHGDGHMTSAAIYM